MKYLFYLVGFGLMVWAIIEQTKEQPNIYVQVAAVVVFFYVMMRLMNRTPGNFEQNTEQEDDEQGN